MVACVPCPDRGSLSKVVSMSRRPLGTPTHRLLVAGFMTPVVWLLSGCGSSGDLISSVALPSEQAIDYADVYADDYAEGAEIGAPPTDNRESGTLALTPAQRDFLDALVAAGIHTSNELGALSIGSYVCQARAAGHNDQAVWDSVAPKVRSDIAATHAASPQTAAVDADAAVGLYIRSATDLLC